MVKNDIAYGTHPISCISNNGSQYKFSLRVLCHGSGEFQVWGKWEAIGYSPVTPVITCIRYTVVVTPKGLDVQYNNNLYFYLLYLAFYNLLLDRISPGKRYLTVSPAKIFNRTQRLGHCQV